MILDRITSDEKEQMQVAYRYLNHLRTTKADKLWVLVNAFGSPIDALDAMYKQEKVLDGLVEAGALKGETRDEIMNDDLEKWYEWSIRTLEERRIGCVTPVDARYPSRLQDLPDKPLALYYRGNIKLSENQFTLGVIGSRRPTFYGKAQAELFVNELAARGMTIISGMAYGVDAISHKAAIERAGKTIAVLGGSVDICYPQTNFEIYSEMCDKHLVISEYEPEVSPIGIHFPERNRIISGLSDGLLVVEAAQRSGTVITVDRALEQGKTIYGIPGRVNDTMSKGVNRMIKQGAMLVDSPSDVIGDIFANSFEVKKPHKYRRKKFDDSILPVSEREVFRMLGTNPTHMDDIIRSNNMRVGDTIHILGELENKGLIECIEKSYYIRKQY
ncbi:DNA processing protein [Lachnospiraceae bacterium NE2001]|nr:DNA processing protein [Lachnospiraceae bacterium NE2001]